MTQPRTTTALIVAAAAMTLALGGLRHANADEGETEKPVASHAARLSRDAAGRVFIALGPSAQKESGIATAVLKAAVRPIEVEAYGFILNPAALSRLNSDLLSAQAAMDAAAAQYRRTRRLYAEQKNASLRDLQTAQASYLTAQSRLEALAQQLCNDWGAELARMEPQRRAQLVSALVQRREAIARLTAPIGDHAIDQPRTARIRVLGREDQPLTATAVYAAPAVLPGLQGQTFLALVGTTEFPVRPGTAVSARIPAANGSQFGVMVPRSAVVRYAGGEWVYRELDGNRFVRLQIVPAEITSQGYFVTDQLAPSMRIVVTGAQTLLSEELKAQIQVED